MWAHMGLYAHNSKYLFLPCSNGKKFSPVVGKTGKVVLFRLQRQRKASDHLVTLPGLGACLHT